jgi:FkbM family methyltransferase
MRLSSASLGPHEAHGREREDANGNSPAIAAGMYIAAAGRGVTSHPGPSGAKRGLVPRSNARFELVSRAASTPLTTVKRVVSASLNALGVDVIGHQSLRHPVRRRVLLLRSLGVDVVYDVGANEGQYGRELRAFGYKGRIVSFEPLSEPFRALTAAARRDPLWRVARIALGDTEQVVDMHVTANRGASSSILPALKLHLDSAPYAQVIGRERVQVRRLDAVLGSEPEEHRRPFLKVDVQGFEDRVLTGAGATLECLVGLQIELQLFPLYAGAPTFADLVASVATRGFALAGIEPVFAGADGRLLAADGLFIGPAAGSLDNR